MLCKPGHTQIETNLTGYIILVFIWNFEKNCTYSDRPTNKLCYKSAVPMPGFFLAQQASGWWLLILIVKAISPCDLI